MSVPRCRNSEPANWTKMWRAKLPWNLNVKPLLLEFPSATMIWLWILWYISGCKICQISTTLWSSEKSSERSDSLNFLLVSSYWFPIGSYCSRWIFSAIFVLPVLCDIGHQDFGLWWWPQGRSISNPTRNCHQLWVKNPFFSRKLDYEIIPRDILIV